MGEYREEYREEYQGEYKENRNEGNMEGYQEVYDAEHKNENSEEDSNKDLKEKYERKGMIYIIIGLVEIALCGIVCGAFTGGPVILFGILGMKEAQNSRFDAAKKKYLIAKIAAIIGGFLWTLYLIGLLILCYIINH